MTDISVGNSIKQATQSQNVTKIELEKEEKTTNTPQTTTNTAETTNENDLQTVNFDSETVQNKQNLPKETLVTVQAWGKSKANEGFDKPNDCLWNIVYNNYKEMNLSNDDYWKVINSIKDNHKANGGKIGNKNSEYTIFTGDKIYLPTIETDESGKIVNFIYKKEDEKVDKQDSKFEDEIPKTANDSIFDNKYSTYSKSEQNKNSDNWIKEIQSNNGNILSCLFDKDGKLKNYTRFEYDKNGNLTLQKTYDNKGNLIDYTKNNIKEDKSKTETKYNADGQKTSEINYDKDGNIVGKVEFEYKKDGDKTIIVETSYDYKSGGYTKTSSKETTYDKNGNKV